jgi:hemoglobin
MRAHGGARIASLGALLFVLGLLAGCCCPRKTCCPCPCDASRTGVNGPKAQPSSGQVQALPGGGFTIQGAAKPGEKPLFERLGGIPGITAATDDFLPRLFANATVMGNATVRERLMKADAAAVRQRLIDQLCDLTGGPCTYKGKDMKTAHTGLGITAAEWNAGVGDFAAALDHVKVPAREKGELVAIIQAMKGDIVAQ